MSRRDGKWTCIRCRAGFEAINGSRICDACADRACEICGAKDRTARSDMRWCNSCKPAAAVLRASDWYFQNKQRKREYDAKRRSDKRQLYRDASKRWRDANPEKKNADTSARRQRVRAQMPKWMRPSLMVCFYEKAKRVSECLGIEHHVDHVIPLRGRKVSGLHVPWNLHVIPARLNLEKHNRYGVPHEGSK
jgi:hypothetical protein